MKPKTLILIVAAVGCGLAASYMTSQLIAQRSKDQPVEEEKVKVVVAKHKIPQGILVKDPGQYFQVKEFNASQAPKKALSSLDDVKDRRLNKPLASEQFITSEDLQDGKGNDLAVAVPPGHRAVAIRANMESASGGWVQPNSRVDLIVTVKRGDQDSWSRIFMQNMLVLAVDLQDIRDPEKKAIIPSVVTFAATPQQTEQLSMAQALGEIRLVLREPLDDKIVHTSGARFADVLRPRGSAEPGQGEGDGPDSRLAGSASKLEFGPDGPRTQTEPPESTEPKEPPAPKTHKLVILNGENITTALFLIDHTGAAVSHNVERQEVTPPRPAKPAPAQPVKPEKPATSPEPSMDKRSGT